RRGSRERRADRRRAGESGKAWGSLLGGPFCTPRTSPPDSPCLRTIPLRRARLLPSSRGMPRTREPVPILLQDAHLLVVSKPAGMLSVATPGAAGLSLPDALRREGLRVFPVHRLDREV